MHGDAVPSANDAASCGTECYYPQRLVEHPSCWKMPPV